MQTAITLAQAFVAALRTPGGVAALLSPDAEFASFNAKLSGRDAVAARFESANPPYGEMTWSEAEAYGSEPHGDAAKLTGVPPAHSLHGGVILLIHAQGNAITRVNEQNRPAKLAPSTAMILPDSLKNLIDNALATKHPMTFAYVDLAGQPVLSFRGSMQAHGDDQLAAWIRNAGGDLVRSIAVNPKVGLMYRDEDTKATFSFRGRARIADDPAVRQAIYDKSAPVERAHDWAQTGVALIIDLDRVEGWAGMGPGGQVGRINLMRGA